MPLNPQCNVDLFNKINIETQPSLFSAFTQVTLWQGTTIPEEICPLVFKDASLDVFTVHAPFKLYPFEKMDKLNASIGFLDLYENDYILDEEHIDPILFKDLRVLKTNEANIIRISDSFMSSFPNLDYVHIKEKSLGNFFKRNGMKWLRSFNAHVNVDFSNQESIQAYSEDDMKTISFDDESSAYKFPDEDFCYFKDFPHNHLVFFQRKFHIFFYFCF